MDHSALWLWLPDVLVVVSIATVKWVLLALTYRWVHAGLLRALCTLIDCLHWLLMCYSLYLIDVTPPLLCYAAGLTFLYYLIQPELTAQLEIASANLDAYSAVAEPPKQPRGRSAGRPKSQPQSPAPGRTTSRTRPRTRSSTSKTLPGRHPTPTNPQHRPSRSSIRFGNWSWKSAGYTLYTFLLILYLRTSYTPEALAAAERCLSHPFHGTWGECVAPILRHECPAYYSSSALDTAKRCLETRDRDWSPTPIDDCLRPLYAHRSPRQAPGPHINNLPPADGGDPCWIKLRGLSGTFPWPPSTDAYDILNVSRRTPRAGIRKAYQEAVRRWHPDKGGRVMEKESLDCIVRHVSGAYEKLDAGRRKRGWFS